MAAAVLLAVGLAAFATGELEGEGVLFGRATVDVDRLPFGATKAQHVRAISRLAERDDVSVALIAPDRDGEAARWEAFSIRGTVSAPAFWAAVDEHPGRDIGDADLRGTYAIDGDPDDVEQFLSHLDSRGFHADRRSVTVLDALVFTAGDGPVVAVIVSVTVGVLIALLAEATRRRRRQAVRRLTGWSRTEIAWREFRDIAVLLAVLATVSCGALGAYLVFRGANGVTLHVCGGFVAAALIACIGCVVLTHVAANVVEQVEFLPGRRVDPRPLAVAAAALCLVVVAVMDARAMQASVRDGAELERALVAQAEHGDDVVLGTRGVEIDQEVALASVARRAIAERWAWMNATNQPDGVLVVIGRQTPGLPAAALRRGGTRGVLLIPEPLRAQTPEIREFVSESLSFGWEVDGTPAPADFEVEPVPVRSTAQIVEPVADWDEWLGRPQPSWPEVPVLVLPDDAQAMPLNQLATATANGEVRFSDRRRLERDLRAAGVANIVLSYNRVGATVEQRLGAVRSDRTVLGAALVAVLAAIVLAAITLVSHHRVRTRAAARVRFLTGRAPATRHAAFVVTCAATAGATVAGTLVASGSGAAPGALAVVTGAVATGGAGAAVGALLVAVLLASRTPPGREQS